MKHSIKLIPFDSNKNKQDLSIQLEEKQHRFEVSFSFPIARNINQLFPLTHSQWGLWDFDVFEIFIQKRFSPKQFDNPYTEFQISPLGQFFILEILKRRELHYTPLHQPFSFESKMEHCWNGFITFPKEQGVEYYFNFTSIQGPPEERNHYASVGDFTKPADFHCPHLFRKV